MKIQLANPRGFCAGVDRAIEIVERALATFDTPIYVRHEVVHNRFVVENLKQKGVIFVDELDEVPDGATVIFSAHGVSQGVQAEAARRDLRVFDATCPLVTKVHLQVARHCRNGYEVILIGHRGHPEVEGTMGQYCCKQGIGIHLVETVADVETLKVKRPERLAFVTQTTLSMDDTRNIIQALRRRFPKIQGPRKDDICYATQNRQDAVKRLAADSDVILVVGSPNSSNSNRLKEIADNLGKPAYLVDDPDQLQPGWFQPNTVIGVTAGASAPEELVDRVIERLCSWGAEPPLEHEGQRETITFPLPRALQKLENQSGACSNSHQGQT